MKRAILAAAASALVLAGSATTASAESGSLADPRGDAPEVFDITRFSVTNGDRRWTAEVKVRELRQRGQFSFHYWPATGGSPPPRSVRVNVQRVDGDTKVRFLACNDQECFPEPCGGIDGHWRHQRDIVEITVPQRCFPRPPGNPSAPPPAAGRFFAAGSIGSDYDGTDSLRLDRG